MWTELCRLLDWARPSDVVVNIVCLSLSRPLSGSTNAWCGIHLSHGNFMIAMVERTKIYREQTRSCKETVGHSRASGTGRSHCSTSYIYA